MRFVSVDNVLQYASEIPSGQPRLPPGARPTRAAIRRGSFGAGGVTSGGGAGAGGGGLPLTASAKTGQQIVPSRTTKVSEKLVLLPETVDEAEDEEGGEDEDAALLGALAVGEEETGPLRDEELDVLRKRGGVRGKSYAERLPKVKRGDKVARLTAYCTAQAYKLKATSEFLKKKHEARTKLYDDCLYTVYHLPLLQGMDGYRLRSRPILKTPGTGKTVLDLEIERSERRDVHEGYFDEFAYSVRGQDHEAELDQGGTSPSDGGARMHGTAGSEDRGRQLETYLDEQGAMANNPTNPLMPDAKNFAEMFVFSYGVVVFWNFTEHQEKDILADLTFAENETGTSLVTRPLDEADFETEEFHFEYSSNLKRPRVFNDMITLLPRSDHMVKLTISHAIAQSTKLCFFEERMSETMQDAQHVPKRLALTGELNMTRTEIVKILGRLFKSRVDINLCTFLLSLGFVSGWCVLTSEHSIQHPRRAQLLLGLGAEPVAPLPRHQGVPRDRPAHKGAQRALPRLPRPGRDTVRQRRGPQDEHHHLDRHRAHRRQHPGHRHRGRAAVQHPRAREGEERRRRGRQWCRWRGESGVEGRRGCREEVELYA